MLKIEMVYATTQAVIASSYTMEDGYDKNERPSKYSKPSHFINFLHHRILLGKKPVYAGIKGNRWL